MFVVDWRIASWYNGFMKTRYISIGGVGNDTRLDKVAGSIEITAARDGAMIQVGKYYEGVGVIADWYVHTCAKHFWLTDGN